MSRSRAFTLVEVMVAVAILGLGLTTILAAQAGAFSTAAHARNISVATGLLRCKMSEVEEHLQREGFQELDEADSGPCCEGDEASAMRCSWRVEKPELPEPKYGELDLDSDLGGLGALGTLAKAGEGGEVFGQDAKPGDIAQALAGAGAADGAAGAAGAAQGLLGMVMEMVYPDIKALFEASARRVIVKVTWTQGAREHEIEIMQWVTNPQMDPAAAAALTAAEELSGETSTDDSGSGSGRTGGGKGTAGAGNMLGGGSNPMGPKGSGRK